MRRIAHDRVHVVAQDDLRMHAHTCAPPGSQYRLHDHRDVILADGGNAAPGVPRDVRVQSACVVACAHHHTIALVGWVNPAAMPRGSWTPTPTQRAFRAAAERRRAFPAPSA